MLDKYFNQLNEFYIILNSDLLYSSLFILFVGGLASFLVLILYKRFLPRLAKQTKTNFDDIVFNQTKWPIFMIVVFITIIKLADNLSINGVVSKTLGSIVYIVLSVIISRVLNASIDTWADKVTSRSKLIKVALPFVHKTVKSVIFVFVFIAILKLWQLDITPYLAGVGISGLVLGFALQDSLKNIFGGVTLILDHAYKVGDKLKLPDGQVGLVYDIGLRSTKVKTYDNQIVHYPNGYLANHVLINYSQPSSSIRVVVPFSVSYGNDIHKVKSIILPIIEHPNMATNIEPSVDFLEMADFSLKFQAKCYAKNWGDAWDIKLYLTEKIYDTLNLNNLEIPFPTQTIHLKK